MFNISNSQVDFFFTVTEEEMIVQFDMVIGENKILGLKYLLDDNNKLWFLPGIVLTYIRDKNPEATLNALPEGYRIIFSKIKKNKNNEFPPNVIFVNLNGLQYLIDRSYEENARTFDRWFNFVALNAIKPVVKHFDSANRLELDCKRCQDIFYKFESRIWNLETENKAHIIRQKDLENIMLMFETERRSQSMRIAILESYFMHK